MMVTEVCGGTMTWGSFNANEADAHAQLDKLWSLGVNFIDTAELYPVAWNYGATTERWIGNWLKKRTGDGTLRRAIRSVHRHQDKPVAHRRRAPDAKEPATPHGYDAEICEWSCRKSIERMRCEYIDLYQIHWPSRDTPIMSTPTFTPEASTGLPSSSTKASPRTSTAPC